MTLLQTDRQTDTRRESLANRLGEIISAGDTGQRRAKVGGEYGANGEWYEGGKWIANADNAKSHKETKRPTGRQKTGPNEWR